jgi:hypothetical protein
MDRLCIGKDFAIGESNPQLGVFAVEIVLQTIEIAGTLPFAHWKVVE